MRFYVNCINYYIFYLLILVKITWINSICKNSNFFKQGFQLCYDQEQEQSSLNLQASSPRINGVGSLFQKSSTQKENTQEYKLSIGRVYHKIVYSGSSITVSIYRPRWVSSQFKIFNYFA